MSDRCGPRHGTKVGLNRGRATGRHPSPGFQGSATARLRLPHQARIAGEVRESKAINSSPPEIGLVKKMLGSF